MHEIDPNDEVSFDRLVDGEISSAERRRLLASLDDRPGGWRQCALAFLEAQSWRTDLGQVIREAEVAPVRPHPHSSTILHGRFARRPAIGWLAIAASLLVGFGLGLYRQGGTNSPAIASGAPDNGQHIADMSDRPERPAPSVRHSNDALTFWVRDAAGGTQPVHVPLIDAAALDRQLGVEFRSGLPEGVREHLQKNGYDLQSTRRYAPLWLEHGRSLVVPVEDTRIVPVSPVVY
ncbi:MAG: hypothetical protein WD669_10325 [Pirellulales bacterium]